MEPMVWRGPSRAEPISFVAMLLRCAVGGKATPAQLAKWLEDPDLLQIGMLLLQVREVVEKCSGGGCECGVCVDCSLRALLALMDAAAVEHDTPADFEGV